MYAKKLLLCPPTWQRTARSLATRPRPRPLRPSDTTPSVSARSRVPLYMGGAVLYGASIYLGFLCYTIYYPASDASASPPSHAATPHDSEGALRASRPEVYDAIAATYDDAISLDETLMGLGWLRWSLVRPLRGDVLEVSAGTARNLRYYDPSRITSLTLVDQSPDMLQVAQRKLDESAPTWRDVPVTLKAVPLEALSPARDSYDVVVQSFGLCSVSDPVAYLSHLAQFCRADGSIVLLEHGRAKYDWINRILDNSVTQHAEKWGCYFNRDVTAIVEACRDVEVVSLQRWHFGTTYVYHLRPKQDAPPHHQ